MTNKTLGPSGFQVGETVAFINTAGDYRVLITSLKDDRLVGHFSTIRRNPTKQDVIGGFFYSEIKPGTVKRISPPAVRCSGSNYSNPRTHYSASIGKRMVSSF